MGKVYVVATPIGNLSDISPRAIEVLGSVDLIAAEDTRRTIKLLNHFEIKTQLVSYHKFNENNRGENILRQIIDDDIDVAIVSDAGTPGISDPGSVLVNLARENVIEVIGIPGASAVATALSISGFEIKSFAFMGFVPRKNKEKSDFFEIINESGIETFVLFESPNRIIDCLEAIEKFMPGCRVLVCNDLSKVHEKSIRGNISEVKVTVDNDEKSSLGEYTVVVQKPEAKNIVQDEISSVSIEALLIDAMVKENCTVKEAMESVVSNNKNIRKNDVYKASLKLKDLL
jgi:16S rRNA (cytidine1402-2'-O)-methyltransferase